MIVLQLIAILFIVSGVTCEDKIGTIISFYEGNETDVTSFEILTASTGGSQIELTSETTASNQTDIDTSGDIIITSETENDADSFTATEGRSTETVITSTEPEEIITVSDWSACSFNPCKNGGTCEKNSADPNAYKCNCIQEYTGTHCQVLDSCVIVENETCPRGACVYEEDGLSKSCACFFGMSWDDDLKECRDPDPPCFPNPCRHGTCVRLGTHFHCSCHSGYDGESCALLNECGEEDACENGECILNPLKNLKYCQCNSDFYWNENSERCEDFDLPCHPNPCKYRGTCEALSLTEFNCTCAEGFIGQACEIQDLCAASNNGTEICDHGECMESKGVRECRCNEGHYLDRESRTCKKIMKPCLPNPCSNEGKCTPLDSSTFNCTCSEGYTGPSCSDYDYCILKGGNSFCRDAQCKSVHSLQTYYCSCSSGQYFQYGTRMCIGIDFCPLMKCGENEECVDNMCDCKKNYKRDNSTGKCKAHFCVSNPCPVDDLICTEGDGIRRYKCACKSGNAFNGTHCNAGAFCLFPALNSCDQKCAAAEDGYVCGCYENHFKLKDNATCEYIGNVTCTNKTCDRGVCLNTEGEEMCICPPGFEEVDGKCVDLCSADHLPEGYCPGNQCEPVDSGFRCKCEGKYTLSWDGITCTARRMCHEGETGWSMCSERCAECVDDWSTPEGFRCQCRQGQVESEGRCQGV
ncbi:neurogenic locus notch homolog protein 1 [Trichonephila clavipes]|uniref:Neurogenic locus notch homolog protein 1 n=1 Tax=Trichonephila clavipes TaxID=2585209 RepID=A0A8X6VM65_TRICX|nr:neurogenic locus notch homolog protein 1 [Trichonephila clavipes]